MLGSVYWMKLESTDIFKNQNYSNGVVIDGENLFKLKKVLLNMVSEFDAVCTRYNLYYSLCGGSLLGAIRHNGFIPWDEDVDVFMTRDSYNKFVDVYNNELSSKYTLHSPEMNPQDGMPLAQLSLNGTIYRTQLAPNRKNPGIFIDIFIIENVPDNYMLRMIHCFFSMLTGFMLSCTRMYKDKRSLMEFFSNADDQTIKMIKNKIFIGLIINKLISLKSICKINNLVNSFYNKSNTKYVACPSGRRHYCGEIFERKYIMDVTRRPFEKLKLCTMKNANYYLSKMYGDDYMTPPAEDKREVHCVMELDLGE